MEATLILAAIAQRFHLALDEFGRVMDACRSGQRKAGTVTAAG